MNKLPIEILFPELSGYCIEDFKKINRKKPVVMLAMTARTGSSHLCSNLASILKCKEITELFNARDNLCWQKERFDINTFVELINTFDTDNSPIFFFKTSWLDFEYFKDKFFHMFPQISIIHLERLDIEAQAVSLYKAKVTNHWHNSPNYQNENKLSPEEIMRKYDLNAICNIIYDIKKEKRQWEDFFYENSINPFRICYEHFEHDASSTLQRICDFINCEFSGHYNSQFSKMTDDVNKEWLIKLRYYRSGSFYNDYANKVK